MSDKKIKNILELNINSINFLGDRILLLVPEASNFGGFVIPENTLTRSAIGIVAAVGNGKSMIGKEDIKIDIKNNDIVIYNKSNTAYEIRFAGKDKYILVQYSDIIGVVNNE